jgi:formylglycine-generating enzyme required for sulfatase activity
MGRRLQPGLAGVIFALCSISALAQTVATDPAKLPPLATFQECAACPEMVIMPMGTFIMGGPPGESRLNIHWDVGNIRPVTPDDPYIATQEGPLHAVTIDLPIAMGRNEVTVGEWNACVADGGCGGYVPPREILVARGDFTVGPGVAVYLDLTTAHPVVNVSYDDAQLYLEWLNAKVGAKVYRLPTEAEWEYAARAGTQTPFAQGAEVTTDQANFRGDSTEITLGEPRPDFVSRGFPVPVDTLDAANAWGLRHMSGNVIEMTSSCWTDQHMDWPTSSIYLRMSRDPSCDRVTKGGGYTSGMDDSRLAVRGRTGNHWKTEIVGFRIIRDLSTIPWSK